VEHVTVGRGRTAIAWLTAVCVAAGVFAMARWVAARPVRPAPV